MSEIEGGIQDPDIKFSAPAVIVFWYRWFQKEAVNDFQYRQLTCTSWQDIEDVKHQFKKIGLLRKEYEVNWDEDENLPIERIHHTEIT